MKQLYYFFYYILNYLLLSLFHMGNANLCPIQVNDLNIEIIY